MDWTDLATVKLELVELVRQARARPTIAFDADSTLWASDVANRLWDYLIAGRLLRPDAAPHIAGVLREQGGEPVGDPHRGLAKGHLEFTLEGTRLKGRWHLVRMKPRPGEKKEQWLLIKAEDEFARPLGI